MARHDGGWFRIYRTLIEGHIGQRGNFTLGLFLRLLGFANWKESTALFSGKTITVAPGQVITGLRELSPVVEEDPRMHRARSALRYLEKSATIAQVTCNQGRLITICNWDVYQPLAEGLRKQADDDAQTPRKQRASSAQLSEEVRKKERNTYSPEFEEIYRAYPRKEGKSKGFALWKKIPLEDKQSLHQAVENYKRRKAGTDPQYLLHFSTFMGQWADWLEADAGTATVAGAVAPTIKPLSDLKQEASS